ncbi:hypothetical protein AVEN_179993-1 [Araneus ventricosus]|uniref:Uncharacterized protein n=1 Tax=Araneus ventricosus TaxID=182803 RepID=A0A4Y2MAF5_ARAVE|nr:hypothetical protein AVEN_179993-1 [Araneus ventricosus]
MAEAFIIESFGKVVTTEMTSTPHLAKCLKSHFISAHNKTHSSFPFHTTFVATMPTKCHIVGAPEQLIIPGFHQVFTPEPSGHLGKRNPNLDHLRRGPHFLFQRSLTRCDLWHHFPGPQSRLGWGRSVRFHPPCSFSSDHPVPFHHPPAAEGHVSKSTGRFDVVKKIYQ